MKIVVSGASGLVGGALVRRLRAAGHEVLCLVRGTAAGPGAIAWDPATGQIDASRLEGCDAIIHLAGENIAQGRWTAAKKDRIRSSRVDATRRLCAAIARLSEPPKAFLCASAVGYYGNRGNTVLDETSAAGDGFLAEVCRDWEAATAAAVGAGIRTLSLRFGMVLSPDGGALRAMLPAFRFGLGGPMGNGRQYVSWITLDDAIAAIEHLVTHASLAGAVNLTAPNPVTNREFAAALGRVLRRPALLPTPGWLLKILLGEMAESLLLGSACAMPRRLLDSGFVFRDPTLAAALDRVLGGVGAAGIL